MNLKNIPAYELVKEEDLGDIQSKGYLLYHKKSRARVMVVENSDENKVFNIAFRTPPEDNTGVAHILEHSVLCGSRKFPLKDPFIELTKGSLNTFLNAMTFPDKTMYPVASCNDQDFQNLMDVYLDAVFFPNIYKKEEIFRQEGWSFRLNNENEEITYNGVVYNEMKGVFSSPDEVLERESMRVLFPDSPYGVESGGSPECIPDLTYEEFLDFHRKYYHPSNSYIYLYGNMDMEEKLNFLDQEYLSHFEAKEIDSQIRKQPGFSERKKISREYPVLEGESLEDNTYLSYNMVIGDSLDTQLVIAFEVLDYALLSAPAAPLKQALLDAKIGKDIYGSYDDGIFQPTFQLVAKNANPKDQPEFERIIEETLEKIVKEGINKKSLEAGINYMEFRFREADYASYPRGLMYSMDVFGSWLYDDTQAFNQLKILSVFDQLKEKISTDYFEKLVEKYLIKNTHGAYLTLVPNRGLTARRDHETAEKLKKYKESLTKDQVREVVQKTKDLEAYQDTKDDPQALKCIPMLKPTDIRRQVGDSYNRECWIGDTLVLHHPIETNGIAYLNLYFDFAHVKQEQIPYLGVLKAILGYMDTENYTFGELFNEINANTGGISCGTEYYQKKTGEYRTYFGIRAKTLKSKLPFVFEMIREIIFTSKLDNEKRLYENIARMKSRIQAGISSAGHSAAVQRGFSYGSSLAWLQEQLGGIEFYHFLEDLEKNFSDRKEDLKNNLKDLAKQLFFRENLMVDITGDNEICRIVEEQTALLKELLPTKTPQAPAARGICPWNNEGFMTAGQVQFVAATGNFKQESYTGALHILKVILSYDYLWKNIREKGGAYGCMSGFKRNGEGYFVSYRDPKLKNTLDVYRGIPDYLRKFQADPREMTKYIIGTISGIDIPKTPNMKGRASAAIYFTGITKEERQAERDQILDATPEDIRNLAGLVEEILDTNQICVIGSEEKVRREEGLFTEVKNLISQ